MLVRNFEHEKITDKELNVEDIRDISLNIFPVHTIILGFFFS